MQDAMGPIITLLRDFLVGTAYPAVPVFGGSNRPPGTTPPFIQIEHVVRVRDIGIPTAHQRLQATCYGVTPHQASDLSRIVSDCFQERPPTIRSYTVLFTTWEDSGGQPVADPDTDWPGEINFITAYVAADAVA